MECPPNSRPDRQTITRIVFTGDVFRDLDDDREPPQLSNVFWLHNLLAYQLTQMTGLIPEICFRTRDNNIGSILITEAYKVLGLETSIKGWHRSFWCESVPGELIELFRQDYDHALVFGFELSPLMEFILNKLRCPWINVSISPLRFLSDLLLLVRFSDHFDAERVRTFAVSEKDITYAADYVRRWFAANLAKTNLKNDDVVFFAQAEGDRSLITNDGSFFSVEETVAELGDLVRKRRLWIKPHPYALQNEVVRSTIERLGGRLINENSYGILSADVDIDIVTISSSIGREAPWFNKRAQLLYDFPLSRSDTGLTILDSYCFSDFWRALLEQIMPVSSFHRSGRADVRHPALRQTQSKPNVLREQLGFWGMPGDLWAENTSTSINREIKHARGELQHALAEIAALRASTSWRATALLRWLSSRLRAS
jgi:hypothetical protein